MDDVAFDNLTRTLATSRRGLMKYLVVGLLGGAGGLLGGGAIAAQECAPVRRRCATDGECCSGLCDPATGRCACEPGTELCGRDCVAIDGYQSDVDNCGGCRVRCRRAPECQIPACIEGACAGVADPDQIGQSCNRGAGVCQADGTCACPPERPTACRRGCVDVATDPTNCGTCGNRCRATAHGAAVCTGGVCGIVCDAGYGSCGDRCCAADRACCDGVCCTPGACCNGAGECSAEACAPHCEIDGEDYAADTINPEHDCQVCDPDRSTTAWSPVDGDTACGGVPGRVCCNGECCSPTECCIPTGACEECGAHCRIGGEDIDAGAVNPEDACQVCDPEREVLGWSLADDDTVCGGDLDDELVCCAGRCCGPRECCNDGTCGPCRCEIGNGTFTDGEVNPGNKCEVCKPDKDRDDWSQQPRNAPCGLTNDRFCCAGECCPAGECCNDIGECEPCGCVINGDPVLEDAVNPANTCQVCKPNRDRRDWTVLGDDEPCGSEADDRVCCGGACCPQGQCCVGGACQDCGCQIGDATIAPETINPDNPCQICDPSRARLAWSPVLGEATCGPDGSQVCCGGECCAADECCLLDACGECLCAIGNDTFPADAPNPANPCEVCKPKADPFDWTPVDDDTACGDDRVCCSGRCCESGLCCVLGVCQFCGCRVGEEEVAEFAVNPANECEWCDPVLDPFAWSPRSDEPCGDEQVCCGGICCADGECCGLDGACQPCPCHIDGELRDAGTFNPENPCEVCDPTRDRNAWSHVAPNEPCGDGSGQVCCDGVCCAGGDCCQPETGACGPGPCQCMIGDLTVNDGVRNPENGCEVCNLEASTTDWSPTPSNSLCSDSLDHVCCERVCCPEGECCHVLEGTCGPPPCTCRIGGRDYNEGEIDPDNGCQECDPNADANDWSPRPNNETCGGSTGPTNGVCCQGVCHENDPDSCCLSDGTYGRCICAIDGEEHQPAAINPANECEVCHPFDNRSGWTAIGDGGACGDDFDRVCCGGICCPPGWCCGPDGLCNRCECESASGAAVRAFQTGSCAICCNGLCCGPDECCTAAGVCEPCASCTIDGVTYAAGTLNPTNECEHCDPAVSLTAWSPADHGHCGDQQVCCNGVCCQDRTCCGPPWSTNKSCNIEWCGMTDPCDYVDPCGCTIDGVFYPHQTIDPANGCQWCHAYFSTTSWYDRGDFARCGPNEDQYCCGAVCCALGACCNDAGVCEFESPYCRGCVIGARFYRHLQRNPDNACEVCNADLSTASWTNQTNQLLCGFEVVDGVSYERRCCEGVCCLGGQCCTNGICGSGPCPDL
jgi:hypothetical protein